MLTDKRASSPLIPNGNLLRSDFIVSHTPKERKEEGVLT